LLLFSIAGQSLENICKLLHILLRLLAKYAVICIFLLARDRRVLFSFFIVVVGNFISLPRTTLLPPTQYCTLFGQRLHTFHSTTAHLLLHNFSLTIAHFWLTTAQSVYYCTLLKALRQHVRWLQSIAMQLLCLIRQDAFLSCWSNILQQDVVLAPTSFMACYELDTGVATG
jgi:hypothetical protein